jgi:hypothetical protein
MTNNLSPSSKLATVKNSLQSPTNQKSSDEINAKKPSVSNNQFNLSPIQTPVQSPINQQTPEGINSENYSGQNAKPISTLEQPTINPGQSNTGPSHFAEMVEFMKTMSDFMSIRTCIAIKQCLQRPWKIRN